MVKQAKELSLTYANKYNAKESIVPQALKTIGLIDKSFKILRLSIILLLDLL